MQVCLSSIIEKTISRKNNGICMFFLIALYNNYSLKKKKMSFLGARGLNYVCSTHVKMLIANFLREYIVKIKMLMILFKLFSPYKSRSHQRCVQIKSLQKLLQQLQVA